MIISHKYRYLFVEIPLTASWAIHHELLDCCAGESLLHKHASYPEFLQVATPAEQEYFVFATVRNPLDQAVSAYFKYRSNHKGAFTDPGALKQGLVEKADLQRFRFVQDTGADFESYFQRYHRRTFDGMISLSAPYLDFVIRYERLQQDFSEVLRLLGIAQKRPVPLRNKTQARNADWRSYYTPVIIDQAKSSFGPYMRKWGYEFPAEWGAVKPSLSRQAAFKIRNIGRQFYLARFRYKSGISGKVARLARAALIR